MKRVTQRFLDVTVGQARGEQAAKILREHGIEIVEQGFTGGSTTWTLRVFTEFVAADMQELLWDNGFGWVHAEVAL